MVTISFHWHIIIPILIIGWCIYELILNSIFEQNDFKWIFSAFEILIIIATIGIYGGIFFW